MPDFKIHRLDSIESTNKYCEALDLTAVEDFTCYWALKQTAGVGQRGNHWHSAPGMNLTFSLVLKPTFLPAEHQFRLTQALSLALTDCLAPLAPLIKWPNDIYVGNRKLCGILVSTRLQGSLIASAICGIGLNVNQQTFPSSLPNPTSLSLLTGKHQALEPLLQQLLLCIHSRYESLRQGHTFDHEYLARLLHRGQQAHYRFEGDDIEATIEGVDSYGRLLLTTDDVRHLCCAMKEISLIL